MTDTTYDLSALEAELTATTGPADAVADLVIADDVADLLFRAARTTNRFTDEEVTDAEIRAVHDLVRWGPTAMNTVPLRLLLVRTPEARERLASHLAEHNRERVLAAPLTIVAAADGDFHEHLDTLVPHMPGARDMFPDAEQRAGFARTSALLQVGYLIVGLRAAGLHVGPMAIADTAGVDAEFLADNGWRSMILLNVGHEAAAEGAHRPRAPRLDLHQVSRTV